MLIVSIIGASKYQRYIKDYARELTVEGAIVLYSPITEHGISKELNLIAKDLYEHQQKCRIDMSDIVYVLNPDNFTDDVTDILIEYAKQKGKTIRYYNNEVTESTDKQYEDIKNILTIDMNNTKRSEALRRYTPSRLAKILVHYTQLGGSFNLTQLEEMSGISRRTITSYVKRYKKYKNIV